MEPSSLESKSFNSITLFDTLSFGTAISSYTIAGTKTIELSNKVQTAGINRIDASHASGSGDDVLEVSAFQFSSSRNLTFIGSNDKDVNVNFTGGSGDDTLTTGTINEDASDTLTGGPGEDTFNIIATDEPALITDLGVGGKDIFIISNSAKGVTATVKEDYIAPTETSNNKFAVADVVLVAENNVDIDMVAAGGTFGYSIQGGAAASTLKGSNFADSIKGGERADTLYGNDGADTLEGGGGADFLKPGGGNNIINDAGNGADIILHDEGSSAVIYNTGTDTVTLQSSSHNAYVVATAGGVRTVDATSSTYGVTLDGRNAGANKVTYTGGSGNDSILGGDEGDALTGNDGNDTFTGGLLVDTIAVGGGTNTIVFTDGLAIDIITGFTADDIGAYDLSALETANAVAGSTTIDFVNGAGSSVLLSDNISVQSFGGSITLQADTNVLNYTTPVADAASLELALENNANGIVTSNGQLAQNDAFVIQYRDSDTSTYSFAIAHLQSGVAASTQINAWEVTDLATTNLTTEFGAGQLSFIA